MRPGFYVCTHKLDRGTEKESFGGPCTDAGLLRSCLHFPLIDFVLLTVDIENNV
jgi:hypothetical protein